MTEGGHRIGYAWCGVDGRVPHRILECVEALR